MNNQEIFLSQWLRLKEEVVEKINKSISRGQMISYTELNQFYKGRFVRWEGYTRPEGRWLESQEGDKRERFLESLHSVTLNEVSVNNNLGINPVFGTAGGAGIGLLLSVLSSVLRSGKGFGIGIYILVVLVCAVIPTMFLIKSRNKKNTENFKLMKKKYLEQIDETGEKLAELWV